MENKNKDITIEAEESELAVEKTKQEILLTKEKIRELQIENDRKEGRMVYKENFEKVIAESYGECAKYMRSIPSKYIPNIVDSIIEDHKQGIEGEEIIKKAIIEFSMLMDTALLHMANIHDKPSIAETELEQEVKEEKDEK